MWTSLQKGFRVDVLMFLSGGLGLEGVLMCTSLQNSCRLRLIGVYGKDQPGQNGSQNTGDVI